MRFSLMKNRKSLLAQRENGYESDGAKLNIYHVSPHETQNTDEFITEVCCPVK